MQLNEEVEVTPEGGRQTKLDTRFDLLPFGALLKVAETFGYGAGKHGDNNWRLIKSDSHLNHALRHIALFKAGDRNEDHCAHAATRMLMWLEKMLVERDVEEYSHEVF
jgi:hypothetical protein